jgi:CHAT domain-containing protein
LHEILIPREWNIPPGTQLCFIPDKGLNGIPFGALWDSMRKKYLIEDYTVCTMPSLAFYAARRPGSRPPRRDAPTALLVGANEWDHDFFRRLEPLPGVAREIAGIRTLYHDPQVIEGREATRERFLNELDQYDIVQVAGHAIFNPRHPEHSYLVLAPTPGDTGALFASEIAGRRLERLRLVILAACSTLGRLDSRTAGLSGLTRPFLDAGASAVIGTLWDTRDTDAELLLPDFHRRYIATGDASASLRDAQLALLRSANPNLRSPAVWGGFQLVGTGH